jgi:hypothetical protein
MSHVDDEDDPVDPDARIAPRTPLFTIILCFLNLAAVLAAGFLLLKDLAARQHWAELVFRHDLAIQGLPLEEDEALSSAAQVLNPQLTLDPKWLQKEYEKRTSKTLTDDFRATELKLLPIRPSQLREDGKPNQILKDHFKGRGEPVATLDEEVKALEKKLPDLLKEMDDSLAEAVKGLKTDAEKRNYLRAYLLPLLRLRENSPEAKKADEGDKADKAETDPPAPKKPKDIRWREVVDPILQLNSAIEATRGKDLDALIVDAARRKLLVDILRRLEAFRPYDPRETWPLLNEAATLKRVEGAEGSGDKRPVKPKVALTQDLYLHHTQELVDLLGKRVQETTAKLDWKGTERHGLEKRRSIAFLLYTLSRFRKPNSYMVTGRVLGEMRALGAPVPPAAREKLQGVLNQRYENRADFYKALTEAGFVQETNKALGGNAQAYRELFYDRCREPLYDPERAEVVSGVREHGRAAETTAVILDRFERDELKEIELDRGQKRYPLDFHVHDPALYANRLLRLLDRMKVQVPNKAALRKKVEDLFAPSKENEVKFKDDEKEPGSVKVFRAVKDLLDKQGIKVANPKDPDAKLKEVVFDRSLLALSDNRAPGYLARHQEMVALIRDLAARVREKEKRLADVIEQEKGLLKQYAEAREPYRKMIDAELLALRDKTRALALAVERYNREIWRAQVELSDADRYNRALERELRKLEQLARNRKKPAK